MDSVSWGTAEFFRYLIVDSYYWNNHKELRPMFNKNLSCFLWIFHLNFHLFSFSHITSRASEGSRWTHVQSCLISTAPVCMYRHGFHFFLRHSIPILACMLITNIVSANVCISHSSSVNFARDSQHIVTRSPWTLIFSPLVSMNSPFYIAAMNYALASLDSHLTNWYVYSEIDRLPR